MCLDEKKRVTVKSGVGYKVFTRYKRKLYQWNYSAVVQRKLKVSHFVLGKWLHERRYRVEDKKVNVIRPSSVFWTYRKGFHLFLDYDSAVNHINNQFITNKDSVIYKVEFKNVVAQGRENDRRVIVAKDIKIIEKV